MGECRCTHSGLALRSFFLALRGCNGSFAPALVARGVGGVCGAGLGGGIGLVFGTGFECGFLVGLNFLILT